MPKRFGQRKPKIYVKNSKKTCVCFSVDIDASRYTLAEKNLLFDILFEGEFCKIHQELSEKKAMYIVMTHVFSIIITLGR